MLWPPAGTRLPPTNTDGRHLIELRQLADRVEHDGVGARLRVDRQLAPPIVDESFMAAEALDLVESFGMARGDDQQRVGPPRLCTRLNARMTGSSSPFTCCPRR